MSRYVDGYGKDCRLSPVYGQLQIGMAARGGCMFWVRQGYRYGAWVVRLGGREVVFESEGKGWYKGLDELLVPKPGVKYPRRWDELTHEIVPGAIDRLAAMLN